VDGLVVVKLHEGDDAEDHSLIGCYHSHKHWE
jgi:hypothetical protein